MSDNTQAAGGGIGFGGLLTVLFVGLKLTHYIDWSWWWVLCPLWIPFAVAGAFVVAILIAAVIHAIVGKRETFPERVDRVQRESRRRAFRR